MQKVEIRKIRIGDGLTGTRNIQGYTISVDAPAKRVTYYLVIVDGKRVDSFNKYRNAVAKVRSLMPKKVKKISKQEANYQDQPSNLQRCSSCIMFHDWKCSLVKGSISTEGWCKHWGKR